MGFESERAAIETRFRDQWLTGSPAALRTPVGWDRQKFEPPKGQTSVRLTILNGDGFNASLGDPGNNIVRYVGVLAFQIYAPGGVGSDATRELIDLLRPIFTNWRSGTLLFKAMNVGTAIDLAPFLMTPVNFPFERDEYEG